MKKCIKCGKRRAIDKYYKHPQMKDGHLNACKDCIKKSSGRRYKTKASDPKWIEKERTRGREKYDRLGYKDKYKATPEDRKKTMNKYLNKYPEKKMASTKLGNFIRDKKIVIEKSMYNHHWSYREDHWLSYISLSIRDHALLHRYMVYDQERLMYRNLKGRLLDSKASHIKLLKKLKGS